jgi:beta-N-acetylhexosaminidase
LSKQIWFRSSGVAVTTVAVAALTAALFGANANAGPIRATARAAAEQPVAARARQAGNGAVLTSAVHNPSVARALGLALESAVVSALSARQLAGQRVIYGYSGATPPSSLLSLIRRGDVGGVIFFGGNYKSRSQFTAAVKKLEAANAASTNPARDYPLLLMTDQEGGLVRRLPGAPVHSQKWIGARGTAASRANQARKAGSGAAANLLSYGLNVNLAPVLDVYRSAGDFDDQYQRSYSMNPHVVSTLGADFIQAQQSGGVAATVKHFPGLGAATASQNTDLRPVTIRLSKSAIQGTDEYPYTAAINAQVDLVMVSWAIYPNLGSHRPAGLAPAIVQGQLRSRLGFEGVTITDAIGAGGLAGYGSTQNRALKAAEAGMQLILASDSVGQGTQCLAGLRSGYLNGSLPAAAFQSTVAQILKLRASLKP